jgi:predicted CopG family antitoxin
MENIFTNTKPKSKYKQILLEISVYDKLASLKKGSFNDTIKSLLGERQDTGLRIKVAELEDSITQMQERLERLINFNRLKC